MIDWNKLKAAFLIAIAGFMILVGVLCAIYAIFKIFQFLGLVWAGIFFGVIVAGTILVYILL